MGVASQPAIIIIYSQRRVLSADLVYVLPSSSPGSQVSDQRRTIPFMCHSLGEQLLVSPRFEEAKL